MRYQAKNSEFHLSPGEIRRIVDAAPNLRDRLIVELFVYTAVRRAELQQIQLSDIELHRCRMIVRCGKGGKQRIVFLAENLAATLRGYCSGRGQGFLFSSDGSKPMSLRNINYIVASVAECAGVSNPNPRYKNVSPRLLRHSFARNWKRAGGSLESLQKLLGHASLKTTLDVYGCESQSEVEDNYRSVVLKLVE